MKLYDRYSDWVKNLNPISYWSFVVACLVFGGLIAHVINHFTK